MKRILLYPKDPVEGLMGDIIRVLGLCMGRLWLSEIGPEIEAFRRTVGKEEAVDDELLMKAIRRLEGLGIVDSESKIKATYGGGEPDVLVGLKDYFVVLTSLKDDPDYITYLKVIDEIFSPR